tara:strand:- start:1188 stop:1691 length:504 start_codon:yes stop_codon:yes gene_type:complete
MEDLLDNEADILKQIHEGRGLMWESIETFKRQLTDTGIAIERGTEEMKENFPLEHHFENGMYTRKIFAPKGMVAVTLIHKQSHPSFILSGECSILLDTGEVERYKAPHIIQTKAGTQRVVYMHTDVEWACVYKTDATSIEEAEKEIYTENYRELPDELINHRYRMIC